MIRRASYKPDPLERASSSGKRLESSETDEVESAYPESGRQSRVNSQDSEQTALDNGRKTLEEVAAKLNDLDGSHKQSRKGYSKTSSTGLLSTSPFLANLFNQRGNSSGIVVDEEDANQEDNPVADIFAWRFPLVSGLWFSILHILFFLFHFCDYSILTVGSFLFLWQIIVDMTLVKIVPVLQSKGLVSEDVNIHEVVRKNTFFNPKVIKRIAATAYELSDLVIGLWKVTVFEANMSRVLIVGRFLFIVFFRSFSIATTLYILHLILFTIPVGYSTNKVIADAVADGAHIVANENLGRIRNFSRGLVEKATQRATYYYDRSKRGAHGSQQVESLMAGVWTLLLSVAQSFDWLVNKLLG